MATFQSGFGQLMAGSDFLDQDNDLTWGAGTINITGVGFVSVNEGTLEWLQDEPGGVLQVTNDTGDNDNGALFLGPFRPADGGVWMETRVKVDNVSDLAIYAGFTETLALATPVMPAEFATATMTYNGTGGMVGLQFDSDGTTDDWRACAGDGGAASGGAGNGTAASAAAVADQWDVLRVKIDTDGTGHCYLNGTRVASFSSAVTAGDVQYAVLMVENRAASAAVWEVDYFFAGGSRDWAE